MKCGHAFVVILHGSVDLEMKSSVETNGSLIGAFRVKINTGIERCCRVADDRREQTTADAKRLIDALNSKEEKVEGRGRARLFG